MKGMVVVVRSFETMRTKRIEVGSIAEAAKVVRDNSCHMTSEDWYSARGTGNIYINTKYVAHVSYNGRVWVEAGANVEIDSRIGLVDLCLMLGMPWDNFTGDLLNEGIKLRRVDGEALYNIANQRVVHSPDGFEWGYGGSGPADLAYNILMMFLGEKIVKRVYQDFKVDCVAAIPYDGCTIKRGQVEKWILEKYGVSVGDMNIRQYISSVD